MKTDKKEIKIINSVSELHRLLGLQKPSHPLITLIDHSNESAISDERKSKYRY